VIHIATLYFQHQLWENTSLGDFLIEYFIQKQQTLGADRKNAHDPESILDWFTRYQGICEKYRIQPCDQYNFDETGFQITI